MVISREKGVYPPLWLPTDISLTHTSAKKSTAPKFRRILPCSLSQFAGNSKLRLYQQVVKKSVYSIPESLDSGTKGTRISLSKVPCPSFHSSFHLPESPKSNSNCQVPFRFIHSSRTNRGRGYSGLGVFIFLPRSFLNSQSKRSICSLSVQLPPIIADFCFLSTSKKGIQNVFLG